MNTPEGKDWRPDNWDGFLHRFCSLKICQSGDYKCSQCIQLAHINVATSAMLEARDKHYKTVIIPERENIAHARGCRDAAIEYEKNVIPQKIKEARAEWERELNNPEINQLAQRLYLPLLAQWIAIENNETRLQADKYLEDAQELADWLSVIGYITKESHLKIIKEAEKQLIEEITKSIDGFHTEDDGQKMLHLPYTDWQQLKKSKGV
jgi:hypothetical protein